MAEGRAMWDFNDPAGSEARFRAALEKADARGAGVLLTQIARALGLQERFDEAQGVLDSIVPTDAEVAVRMSLERGRLLRSAKDGQPARPFFEQAVRGAHAAGLEALEVDALHMVALTLDGQEQLDVTKRALEVARGASDPEARNWEASLLNNIGMAHSESGDWDRSLAAFEEALDVRRRGSDFGATNIARWMVAWALRNLGRTDEALAAQVALKADLDELGEDDPYVVEELALLGHSPVD